MCACASLVVYVKSFSMVVLPVCTSTSHALGSLHIWQTSSDSTLSRGRTALSALSLPRLEAQAPCQASADTALAGVGVCLINAGSGRAVGFPGVWKTLGGEESPGSPPGLL